MFTAEGDLIVTHHLPNPVVLDPALPRCRPYAGCPRSSNCASFLVLADGRRALVDYSAGSNNWSADSCSGWRDVSQHRPDPAAPAPTVHDTPEGLR